MADGSFLQPFDVTTAVDRKAGTTLTVDKAAVAADAFVPLTFSSNGAVAGKTVYVGYGVEDATIKVHDYKGKNVKGKIVVVRRFVPDGKPYDDEATRRRDGDLHTKAITSTAGWQRRLGRRWRTLHRLVYAAAVLSVWHYLWLDRDILTTPILYALIVGALLAVRFARRVWPARGGQAG